jgi:mono/diheme cytochrome c family protein
MTRFLQGTVLVLLGLAPAMAEELSHSQIERGRYLATAANCISCHTDVDNGGSPWSGGRELETPFGVIVTPNITSDDETGIGRWTRDEFWRALHEGIRRDGAHLYPAFPYPYFTRMPRQDVDAIYDYLRTIPPVRAERVPEEELPAPLRIRESVIAWKALNFEQGVFQADPTKSAHWNRGAYLVNGPGHCAACHTEKDADWRRRERRVPSRGVLENWHAPNIRGGQNGGIARWTEDDIVEFLGTGRAPHTIAMSRMGEVVEFSTQHLEEEDLRSIAVYLKDLDDETRDDGEPPDDAVMRAGEALYFDNCAACHRTDGGGVPYTFAQLDGSNKVNSSDPTTVIRVVLEGAQAHPTDARPTPLAMPVFKWKLSDEQIANLLSYVRKAWGNDAPPVTSEDVGRLRQALSE